MLMDPGHRRNETSPIHTQWLCFVQSCLVPTEYFDHVTLAYPGFKAEIKRFTQFSLAFQADTKSPAEPLWGHSLVWRTTCQRAEDESFSETQSRISPSSTDPLHRSCPFLQRLIGWCMGETRPAGITRSLSSQLTTCCCWETMWSCPGKDKTKLGGLPWWLSG